MKKKVTNIEKNNNKAKIVLAITAVLALSSVAGIFNKALEEKNQDTATLEYYLTSYGYEDVEDMSLNTAGYNLGYENSFYRVNYDLNTEKEVTPKKEIFDNLSNVYQGDNKEGFQKGLKKGINDGTEDATNNYLGQQKTR